ncbi:MAG TPA: hypothetical protein GX711_10040 [Clostridia bacterium]|nr:hypothetical protein [Clostridia bacterium]
MYGKICPYCGGKSFSAARGIWECPYCGRDISHIPAVLANQILADEDEDEDAT